jgi:hypothetical protein
LHRVQPDDEEWNRRLRRVSERAVVFAYESGLIEPGNG